LNRGFYAEKLTHGEWRAEVGIEQRFGLDAAPAASPKRVLAVTCGNHAVHDGYTDTLYLLLPLWQAEFQLSYAAVGIMRALYSAVLAAFQVPAASLSVRVSPVLLLAAGTALSGLAYMLAGASAGLPLLVVSLMLGGLGSSTLHPIGSDLVASAFHGNSVRPALGTFNFAGDVGKMAFPTGASLLLAFMSWRETAFVIGGIGVASALAVLLLLPYAQQARKAESESGQPKTIPSRLSALKGFRTLLAIGIADSATRMAFMTFLPFVLAAKGASLTTMGLALTLTFAGGAFGKLACGLIGARLGVTRTIIATKAATAALIATVLVLPVTGILAILPLLGTMLNGTSSVVYGSVPDFCAPETRAKAFGVFYTATIGAGALSPIFFGSLTDRIGLWPMTACIACTALITLPLAVSLPVTPATDR
jgi:MFS transporter, FSR family, fosmidomycin resistance protein